MYKIPFLEKVNETIVIPADKSISHRAIIISSLYKGKTAIKPVLLSDDTRATIACMRKLGIKVSVDKDKTVIIEGKGMYFPKNGRVTLYAHESGTTIRILSGLLSAQKFDVEFTAAPSLNKRPMKRIIDPLKRMNAKIDGKERLGGELKTKPMICPPLTIKPTDRIKGGELNLPVASAQVKSAVMLASLYADGKTIITEPYLSRDHTERMLKLFKVNLQTKDKKITCYPAAELISPGEIFIPSDFSSAAFFIVLGLILKKSKLTVKNVSINPTRCGLLKVLKKMEAKIQIINIREEYEPYADIIVESSRLKAPKNAIPADEIPSMIDEIPILSIAAAFAEGETVIQGVNELKVKETDRIHSIVSILSAVGVDIYVDSRGEISIKGANQFNPANFSSFGDHRTAMSAIILGIAMGKQCYIDDVKCINKSFPEFIPLFESLGKHPQR